HTPHLHSFPTRRSSDLIERYKPDLGKHNEAAQSDRSAWVKTVHEHKSRHFQERLQNGQVPLRAGEKRLFAQAHAADLRIAIVTKDRKSTRLNSSHVSIS